MTERLHQIMNDQEVARSTQPSLSRHERFIRHTVPLVLGASAFAGIAVGTEVHYLNQTEILGTTTGTVNNGESPKKAIIDGVVQLAEEQGFDVNSVSGAENASKKVTKEVVEATGAPVQPGLTLDIEVKRNNWGTTWVDADRATPTNLAHLSTPEK